MFEYTTTSTYPLEYFVYLYVENCKQLIETEYYEGT